MELCAQRPDKTPAAASAHEKLPDPGSQSDSSAESGSLQCHRYLDGNFAAKISPQNKKAAGEMNRTAAGKQKPYRVAERDSVFVIVVVVVIVVIVIMPGFHRIGQNGDRAKQAVGLVVRTRAEIKTGCWTGIGAVAE